MKITLPLALMNAYMSITKILIQDQGKKLPKSPSIQGFTMLSGGNAWTSFYYTPFNAYLSINVRDETIEVSKARSEITKFEKSQVSFKEVFKIFNLLDQHYRCE